MAAGAWQTYGAAIENIAKTVNLDIDSFRMALVTDAYVPNLDVDDTWSDVSANEVVGTGYTQHGEAFDGTIGRTGGTVTFDGPDISWAASTITAKYAVLVRSGDGTTLAPGDFLIAYSDLDDTGGGSVSTTNGTFAVTINAAGVLTLARAA